MKKFDVSKMSLREKIAQTMIVRQSDLLLKADKLYSELREENEATEILKKNQFGGIWIHGNRDINGMSDKYNEYFDFDTKKYTCWLKKASKEMNIPPICASDPRGCYACKDLSHYIDGLIIGAADSEKYAYELGKCMANESRAMGGNWLWTPYVDLPNKFSAEITRPFSNNPDRLIKLSNAFVSGMQSAGVAATAKHFPGRDTTELRDSHIILASINTPFKEWKKNQGSVFQKLIDNGVYTIMTAALSYPEIDSTVVNGKYLPAGLSEKIIMGLLKKEMGFDGVVITDDVNMGGFTTYYPCEELYARFLAAGNDMLLGVGVDGVDMVYDCVKKGIVTEKRITDACERILKLKEKVGLLDENFKIGDVDTKEAVKHTSDIQRKIAECGVTVVRNKSNIMPLKEKPKTVTIYTFTHDEDIYNNLKTMKDEFIRRGATVDLKRTPKSFEEIAEVSKASDLIIYVGYIEFHSPMGAPSFYGEEFWHLRYAFTAGGEKSIGVSLGYPFIHYNFMDDALNFVNLYTPDVNAQIAFVKALYGEIEFKGKAPLNIEIN